MGEGEIDGLHVLAHIRVDVHAGQDAVVLDAKAQGEIGVKARFVALGLEVRKESGFVVFSALKISSIISFTLRFDMASPPSV